MIVHQFTENVQSLESFLKTCRIVSESLIHSKDSSCAFKLANILALLHQKRLSAPNDLKNAVIQTIFQIHDKALHNSIPLIKQQAQNATVMGFERENPVNDIKVMNQILNRMVMADYTKGMLPTVKRMIPHMLDLYLAQNYQSQDDNLNLANKLKFLISSIDNAQHKKNITDKRWLHENAQKLARISPVFQSFADQYPQPVKHEKFSMFSHQPYALGEAPNVYRVSKVQQHYKGLDF